MRNSRSSEGGICRSSSTRFAQSIQPSGTVGIFDVSHMGQITVAGPDAATLTQRLTTNDVTVLDPGEAQYGAITDEDGIMLDDTVVYRLPEGAADEFLFIPNAGHAAEMPTVAL